MEQENSVLGNGIFLPLPRTLFSSSTVHSSGKMSFIGCALGTPSGPSHKSQSLTMSLSFSINERQTRYTLQRALVASPQSFKKEQDFKKV